MSRGSLALTLTLLLCVPAISAERATPRNSSVLLVTGDQLENPQTAIEEGTSALDSIWDYPWYDDANDGVRPLEIELPKPPPPPSKPWNWNFNWSGWFPTDFFSLVVYILAGIVLLVVCYVLFRAYQERDIRRARRDRERADLANRRGHADRVEALPFELISATTDLLAEARLHYEAQNYNLAIVYLYSHELVELDKHNVIHLTKGKTNRQYLREVGPRQPLGQILDRTIVQFERAFFGHHKLHRRDVEQCWNELTEFNRLLAPMQEQAVA